MLQASYKHGVKRLVITSSVAAVKAMAAKDKPDPQTGFYDEKCWGDPNCKVGMWTYYKSKILAEKAAWDF